MLKKLMIALLATNLFGGVVLAGGADAAPGAQLTPYLSVGTDMLLLDAHGQQLGYLNQGGLLFERGAAGDVRSVLVVPGSRYQYRINGINLGAQRLRQGTPELEWYGPAGQVSRLALPNLEDVRWMSVGGRVQGMKFD